jgi:hypothetical protein
MGGSDDDFDDFLKRRKPVFRPPDDMFEPPEELDRVVLRQAREAIEAERPARVFRSPRWAASVALAATLVMAFTVLFYAGLPQERAPVPEVTVQNVAEQLDLPQAEAPRESAPAVDTNNPRAADERSRDSIVVDLNAPGAAKRNVAPGAAAPMGARAETEAAIAPPSAASSAAPYWRRDAKTWLAEIERLRIAGDTARADAELAEFKRQQRAYAGAPDR